MKILIQLYIVEVVKLHVSVDENLYYKEKEMIFFMVGKTKGCNNLWIYRNLMINPIQCKSL